MAVRRRGLSAGGERRKGTKAERRKGDRREGGKRNFFFLYITKRVGQSAREGK